MARHIEFTEVINFRDMGGYQGHNGCTIPWGVLYRSGNLGRLEGEGLQRFQDLGITTVIDLRYPSEIERNGRVPHADGLTYHNLSIEHRPYRQGDLAEDVDTVSYLAERYLEVTEDGVAEIRQVLQAIAAAPGPLVFHCAAGKDRTGIIGALLLTILGVSEQDIVADFALTGLAAQRLRDRMLAKRGENAYLWPGYGTAPAELMELFLAKLKAAHGSVEEYLTKAVGLTQADFDAIRARLLS